MLDKNGRLFGKVSVIDLMAIIIVVIVAVGTIYRFNSPKASVSEGEATLVYTVKIPGVRDFTAQYYQEGLNCYDKKSGELIGAIKSVRVEPYLDIATKTDGTIARAIKPGLSVIYLEIEVTGTETDYAYFARGTYELKAGSAISFSNKYIDVTCYVESVERIA